MIDVANPPGPGPGAEDIASTRRLRRGAQRRDPQNAAVDVEVRQVARDSSILTVGLLVTWALSLGVRVTLPHTLDSTTFGQLIFAESMALLVFAPLALGIDTFARREVPRDAGTYPRIARGVWMARLLAWATVAALSCVVLVITEASRSVVALFVCFAAAQFLLTTAQVGAAFLHGGGRATAVTVTQIVAKLVWAAVAVVGLLLGGSALVVPIALAVGEAIRVLWIRRANRAMFGAPRPFDRTATRFALLTSLPFLTSQISVSVSNSLDTTMVGFIAGAEEVGYYGVATMLGAGALFLAPALGSALLPALSRTMGSDGLTGVNRLAGTVLQLVLVVAMPATTLLVVESSTLIHLLFGPRYAPAAGSLQYLAVVFFLTYVAAVTSAVLVATGRGWPVTLTGIATVVVNTALNAVLLGVAARSWGPGGASRAAALALCVAEAITVASLMVLTRGVLLRSTLVKSLVRSALLCSGLVVLHTALPFADIARLAVEGVAGLVVIAAGVWAPLRRLRAVAVPFDPTSIGPSSNSAKTRSS